MYNILLYSTIIIPLGHENFPSLPCLFIHAIVSLPCRRTAMCNISSKSDDVNTRKSINNNSHEKSIFEANRNPDPTDYVIQQESECNLHRVYQRHPTLTDMDERFEEIASLLEKFILVDEDQIVPSKGKCFLLGKRFHYIQVFFILELFILGDPIK